MTPSRVATIDPGLSAVVLARAPLRYREGADAPLDRPAHVRAGSSIARVPGGIAVVQDDANFIAIVDAVSAGVRSITLPAGEAGLRQFDDERGNKAHKLDLEACVAIERDGETVLLALGSGSTARRERIVVVRGWEDAAPAVDLVHVPRLYAALRRAESFAGSELNIEGAIVLGDRVRLFGRGNGEVRGAVRPVNATCDLELALLLDHLRDPDGAPVPELRDITHYDLGALDGLSLGFTDAAVRRDGIVFSATAEDSPDATRDGRVTGSAIGVIDRDGRTRLAILTDEAARPFEAKVEGVLMVEDADDRLLVVVDADDPSAPSMLCTVELRGDW